VPKNIVYFLLLLADCCFEALHKAGKKEIVFKKVKGVMMKVN